MKRPFTRLEKKQLLIFALIAFGIPYLMGIPMAFGYQRGTSLDFFANAQMYYPAAGAIVVFLLTKTEFPMPRRFFYGYLVLTVLFAISSVLSVLIPDANLWVMVINMLTIAGNLALWVLFLLDKREVRFIWGLTWSGPDSRRHFLYVVLFFMLFTGNLLISSFTDNTADSFLALFASPMFWLSLLSLFVSFFLVFSAFFGEEYGWRYFLQPILQEHFGMRKGVLILGVFWGLWHLPLNLFYYAPDTRLQSIAAQLITCIALSVFFAFAYMKTDNIWIPVILHFMNNNIAGLISGGTVSGAVIRPPERANFSVRPVLSVRTVPVAGAHPAVRVFPRRPPPVSCCRNSGVRPPAGVRPRSSRPVSCSRSRASGNPDRRYGMRDMLSDSVCRYARTCCRPYWEC